MLNPTIINENYFFNM